MNNESERAAFEAALDKRAKSAGFEVGRMTECELDNAWWGWRAARAASANETGAEAVGIVHRPALNGQDFSVEWLSPPAAGKLYAAPQPVQADAREGLTAMQLATIRLGLTAAKHFIANGIELGFIRMPDADCPDPAHDAPKLIDDALALLATPQPEPRAEVTEEQPSFKNPLTPYGMLVRALRIVSGTTLMDMAQHLGRGPAELSAIEFGRKPVRDADIVDAAHYFACVGIQSTTHALTIAARTGASS